MRLVAEHQARVHWVVFGCSPERKEEAQRSAAAFLEGATEAHVAVHAFRDAFFPYVAEQIKEVFESLKLISPDLIFTHTGRDLHQDHRVVNQLTWNTFRDHLILEYEIPKYDGDLRSPNVFVGLEPAIVERKIDYLVKFFQTQRSKRWFDEETFRGLMRLRGVESGMRYAEGFYGRKVVL
jgi:LmbE family N-acetylglucosaminyl deacetylase